MEEKAKTVAELYKLDERIAKEKPFRLQLVSYDIYQNCMFVF